MTNTTDLRHCPQPKRQIDRFSEFCTAHGRASYGTPGHVPSPNNCPLHGGSGPHLIHASLGPPESITQQHIDRWRRQSVKAACQRLSNRQRPRGSPQAMSCKLSHQQHSRGRRDSEDYRRNSSQQTVNPQSRWTSSRFYRKSGGINATAADHICLNTTKWRTICWMYTQHSRDKAAPATESGMQIALLTPS